MVVVRGERESGAGAAKGARSLAVEIAGRQAIRGRSLALDGGRHVAACHAFSICVRGRAEDSTPERRPGLRGCSRAFRASNEGPGYVLPAASYSAAEGLRSTGPRVGGGLRALPGAVAFEDRAARFSAGGSGVDRVPELLPTESSIGGPETEPGPGRCWRSVRSGRAIHPVKRARPPPQSMRGGPQGLAVTSDAHQQRRGRRAIRPTPSRRRSW